jgi:predicted peroxiredoxin
LERQIRIWVCEDNDAAEVFQMEHEEPTDEIAIVSQANANLAL